MEAHFDSRKLQNNKTEIWRKKIYDDAVANAIKNSPTGKASVSNDIPVSIMKIKTIDTYCPKLTQIIKDYLKNNFFS